MPRAPRTALFSLSDKTGAAQLARALQRRGVEIVATGGTRKALEGAGVPARDVETLTGFPPLFDGRVKTLHPKIFGAILYDRADDAHVAGRQTYAIPSIDVVVVNLYPFEATIAHEGTALAEAIEQIDIGGVSLLRAAAKNFSQVAALSHPSQYDEYLAALEAGETSRGVGEIPLALRRKWAVAAFERTAEYDAAIAHYLAAEGALLPGDLPGALTLTLPLSQRLRYGTNPQARAAFYLDRADYLPDQLHGKALSYNNLLDLDATLRLLSRAPVAAMTESVMVSPSTSRRGATLRINSAPEGSEVEPRAETVRAAVVKHTVPCGVAQRSTVDDAVRDALAADPTSAFGGVVAVDARVTLAAAQALSTFFLEIVAAPDFDDDALALLRQKKNLRVMRFSPELPARLAQELRVRSALGGVLAEDDDPNAARETWSVVSERQPSAREWQDAAFAWDVVRHVKSNGIVIVRDGVTRGICAGQTNRVSAVQIAAARANAGGNDASEAAGARGAACASDGFFPFADGLEAAAAAGCTTVIAPSGSVRDQEVIAAANRLGIALIFSTHRYFLH